MSRRAGVDGRDFPRAFSAFSERSANAEASIAFRLRSIADLGVMLAVVEAGSFRHAGEALGLTQSGVSRAIARLEAELGMRLFQRHARAVTLTEEGRRYHDDILPLLRGIEDASAAAANATAVVAGTLRVAVDPAVAHFLLAPASATLLNRYPALELEMVVSDRPPDLVAEGFDCCIRFGELPQLGLIARKLMQTRVLTCAAPGYIKHHGLPERPGDLAAGGLHACIRSRDPRSRRPYEWTLQRGSETAPVDVAGRLTVTDVDSLVAACLAGAGVAQLLECHAAPLLASGRLVQLLPDWADEPWPLYAFLPARSHVPVRVRALLDFVAALAHQDTSAPV